MKKQENKKKPNFQGGFLFLTEGWDNPHSRAGSDASKLKHLVQKHKTVMFRESAHFPLLPLLKAPHKITNTL
jgi:hypothetical protein